MNNEQSVKSTVLKIVVVFIIFVFVCGLCIVGSLLLSNRAVADNNIYLNEIMTANKSAYPDNEGEFYDWIELYNDSENEADISGYGISLNSTSSMWAFPSGTKIPAYGYYVVFCSGTVDNAGAEGSVHANFKLNKSGGDLVTLYSSGGSVLDEVTTETLTGNQVMIRNDYNSPSWVVSDEYTPGFENTAEGKKQLVDSVAITSDAIKINEIMAKNHVCVTDAFGQTSDWIEVINTSNDSVDLSGYSLSNSSDEIYKWRFPSVKLPAGQTLVVYCSGRNTVKDNQIHTSFALPESGATVFLSRPDGTLVDRVSYDALGDNQSYARGEDGNFSSTAWATPGFPNTQDGYDSFAEINDSTKSGLIIAEIMVNNTRYCAHNGGNHYDWIELCNASKEEIELSDYYLSKKHSDLKMYNLPDKTLDPGERILIMCSGETVLSTSKYPHANFKINNNGEELFLVKGDEIVDCVYFADIKSGYSYGRTSQGGGFYYISEPTPFHSNNKGVRQITDEPTSETQEGVYNDVDAVSVTLTAPSGANIYYTTDCETPTIQSKKYTEAIVLKETTVVKAIAYEEGKLTSTVLTLSYIINENHTVPVVSLSAEPSDLFGYYSGIYSDGPGYTSSFPHWGANYWKDWEKKAHITLFEDGKEGFSVDCGIKMYGNYGRGYPQKPFIVKFRKIYGTSELHYKLFDQYEDISIFKNIVLRAGSQDNQLTKFRDELFTGLVNDGDNNLQVQAYKACVMYLNGKYWGVYFIREKVDDNFLSQHENADPDSFTILFRNGTVVQGDNDDYEDLISYVESHDMSLSSNYEYVCDLIDVQNYVDFKIAQAYSGNIDLHNVKYYKSADTANADGKWRWIFYDQDYGFRTLTSSVARTIESGFHYISNSLIRNLLKNSEFRDLYLTRFAEQLKTTYSQQTVLAKIDEIYNTMLPEMERHCAKWGPDFSTWKSEVEYLRKVARKDSSSDNSRIEMVLKDLKSTLDLSSVDYDHYFADVKP